MSIQVKKKKKKLANIVHICCQHFPGLNGHIQVLSKFGFGSCLINWVFYKIPKAKNNNHWINVRNVRCLPSVCEVLLFPRLLYEKIRDDSETQGVKVGKTTHQINLMAEDIILYLTHPFDSWLNWLHFLGFILGYS